MNALTVRGVVKRRDQRETLSSVDLSVDAGERIALLGHNGAGKTTLMKIILGLLEMDAGDVTIAGDMAAGSSRAREAVS